MHRGIPYHGLPATAEGYTQGLVGGESLYCIFVLSKFPNYDKAYEGFDKLQRTFNRKIVLCLKRLERISPMEPLRKLRSPFSYINHTLLYTYLTRSQ